MMIHGVHRLSIAPMIDWSYNHFRMLMRMLAPNALSYTEMLTCGAILNHKRNILEFNQSEKPLALQIGGSDPQLLAHCVKRAAPLQYAEINLNLGCPSDRVQAGRFGACLMNDPKLVIQCIEKMKESSVSTPISAKIRIGVDENDDFNFFKSFALQLIHAGVDKIIVHARKAWLTGLNPKQNRTIPPVKYDYVYRLKECVKDIPIIINGNIETIEAIEMHLNYVDGVMLGRLACQNPYAIRLIHQFLEGEDKVIKRSHILKSYFHYISQLTNPSKSHVIKPIMNLACGLPGAKSFKKILMSLQSVTDNERWEEALMYLTSIEALD